MSGIVGNIPHELEATSLQPSAASASIYTDNIVSALDSDCILDLVEPMTETVNPRLIVPTSLEQATKLVHVSFLDKSSCKSILNALKIPGTANARICKKRKVIAAKRVQKQFPFSPLLI